MTVALPAHFEERLSSETVALNLAIGLFTSNEATLGQAAEIADCPIEDLMEELSRRKISLHYDVEEFRQDFRAAQEILNH